MNTLISSVRQILGMPDFYDAASGVWQYDLLFEYFACLILLVFVISCFFRVIIKVISR